MGLASIDRVHNRIQPTSVGETSPILKEKKLYGNDGIVESMEKSLDALSSMEGPADFSTLPTMPWKSLRLK
jgi:hypothetical protein